MRATSVPLTLAIPTSDANGFKLDETAVVEHSVLSENAHSPTTPLALPIEDSTDTKKTQ
jgi:hypothetical protein